VPCPSHHPRLDSSDYIWRRVQVTKLLVMQFSATSCHFIPPNILLSTLLSNIFSLHCYLNVRYQVLHPYRTTGKIILVCILIFTFSDSRREDRRFCAEW
jgi:hypothetical protein